MVLSKYFLRMNSGYFQSFPYRNFIKFSCVTQYMSILSLVREQNLVLVNTRELSGVSHTDESSIYL